MTGSGIAGRSEPQMRTGVEGKLFGLLVGGLSLMLFGVAVLGYQCLLWLRDGVWTQFEVREVSRWLVGADPELGWRGVQQLVVWTLNSPLGFAAIAAGGLMIWAGVAIGDSVEKRRSQSRG